MLIGIHLLRGVAVSVLMPVCLGAIACNRGWRVGMPLVSAFGVTWRGAVWRGAVWRGAAWRGGIWRCGSGVIAAGRGKDGQGCRER